jgi:diguanylate cyclase (GGDEF)-like protein
MTTHNNKHWSDSLKQPIYVAIASFAILGLVAAILVQQLLRNAANEIEWEMEYWAKAFTTKLEGRLEANLAVGYGLDAQVSVLGDMDQAQFEVVAKRLLKNPLNIRHMALAPNLVVSAIYPLVGNELAQGLNYRLYESQRDAVMQAMSSHQVVLAGPLYLLQNDGKQYLIARFPVSLMDGGDWGLISLVIEFDELLADAGLKDVQRKYSIALRGTDGHGEDSQTFFGDASLFESNAQRHTINVPGGEWQMSITLLKSGHLTLLACWYWGVALIICLLASAAVFYLRRYSLQQEQHVRTLESFTAIDPLTQLTSRYQFNEYLSQLIEECQRHQQGFTVLFIDLDHFKDINDSLGHAAGDQLLVQIANTLKGCVRSYDLLCRLSGDEFIVVLKGITGIAEIESRARVICEQVAEPVTLESSSISVTCSVGVAVYPTDGVDGPSLLQHADLAMYESKRAGRNSIYFFNMSMRNEADRFIELSTAIKAALQNHQFEVFYQPIYNVKEQRFSRCEALCRWHNPSSGMVAPMEFISVAEQSGLICDLGAWLAEEVMTFCQQMSAEGLSLNFAINRSPQEFGSVPRTQELIALRDRLNIPANLVTLEITESLLMSDSCVKSQNFTTLKDQHFQFSIDDFGTGYSAINYLRQYPVESIKIDRSFIAELGQSQQADTLVKIIIQMAKSLNIRVVAEGVETAQQKVFLEAIGCDYLQGYYFAKPMPKTEFRQFILNHKIPA